MAKRESNAVPSRDQREENWCNDSPEHKARAEVEADRKLHSHLCSDLPAVAVWLSCCNVSEQMCHQTKLDCPLGRIGKHKDRSIHCQRYEHHGCLENENN